MRNILVIATLTFSSLAVPAYAQGTDHRGHGAQHAPATGAAAPSTAGYQAANTKMHKDMDIAFSGNADVDFVKGMIAHHQGAIDMSKVVLAHGKDAQIKKLAREIIKAQEKEIAMMQAWLKKNAKP